MNTDKLEELSKVVLNNKFILSDDTKIYTKLSEYIQIPLICNNPSCGDMIKFYILKQKNQNDNKRSIYFSSDSCMIATTVTAILIDKLNSVNDVTTIDFTSTCLWVYKLNLTKDMKYKIIEKFQGIQEKWTTDLICLLENVSDLYSRLNCFLFPFSCIKQIDKLSLKDSA